jgi:transcription termination/antitermination protein NusA
MAKQSGNDTNIFEAVHQFSSERGLSKESVLEVIKDSLVSAYKKKLELDMDEDTLVNVEFVDKNEVVIVVHKKVTEAKTKHPLEISLEDARNLNPEVQVGEVVMVREKPVELSRIVSNQARQMVFQRLKEMEREQLFREFKVKEGELTHGYFQRWIDKDIMSIDLGKLEGIMPRKEQNPGEKYKSGDRLKAIISRVELKKDRYRDNGLVITLSRASGDFVKKLFEMEIPEIYDGLVQIIDIARMPGTRTKIVVRASRGDIDPVGACVGMKGVRIQSIVRELGNERIDIIQYSDDPVEYITNLISPARPVEVKIDSKTREALIVVPDESLSLAIGSGGSNVKLAVQLCQYKVDIKSVSAYNEEMTSPEARAKLDRLFHPQSEYDQEDGSEEEMEDEGMSLSEIPGLTKRVIGLLEEGGITDVETLIEMNPEELSKIPGIGKTTAEQIMNILKESVELVEEG